MRLAFDTSGYRAYLDGDPVFVEPVQNSQVVAFSAIVLGELRAGFLRGTRRFENEEILARILATARVLIHEITDSTTFAYASLWSQLLGGGRPIPTNDAWIAADCLDKDFTLLTRDAHFRTIPGLKILP